MVKLFGMVGLPSQILSALDITKSKIERGDSQESKVLPAISAMGELAVVIVRSIVLEDNTEKDGNAGDALITDVSAKAQDGPKVIPPSLDLSQSGAGIPKDVSPPSNSGDLNTPK